jgi:hypothetical protein
MPKFEIACYVTLQYGHQFKAVGDIGFVDILYAWRAEHLLFGTNFVLIFYDFRQQ